MTVNYVLRNINNTCDKAKAKLSPLSCVASFRNFNQEKKKLINAFFKAQFNYCLLVWMLHSCELNGKISGLHETCLRVIHNNNLSAFDELCRVG